MGAVQTISVEVTDDVAQDIDAAIASGDYADAEDVMTEALAVWRESRAAEIARLRRLWEEGLASGPSRPVPDDWAEQVIARGNERLAVEKAASGAA